MSKLCTLIAAIGVVGLVLALLTVSSGQSDAMASALKLGGGGIAIFFLGIIGILVSNPRRED